jgi:hypothetical protein
MGINKTVSEETNIGPLYSTLDKPPALQKKTPGAGFGPDTTRALAFNQSSAGIIVAKNPANKIATSRRG